MLENIVLLDRDLIRMTFIIGVAVSVLLYERTHVTTGSIVVPGYVGVQLLSPGALLITAINSLLTYIVVSRVIPKFTVVYGRARFVLNIVVSVALSVTVTAVIATFTPTASSALQTIGYVIPALVAYDMNRQGVGRTFAAVGFSGAFAVTPALALVAVNPGMVDPLLPFNSGLLPVDEFWFPIAALISTGMSTMLQAGHRLRCGGFIGAMYLGLSAVDPVHTLYLIVLALVTYSVVHHGLKPVMIVFGRRKFAAMIMLGALLSWVSLHALTLFTPGGIRLADMPIAALAVPALLANDMERSSPIEVLTGALIAGAATLSALVVITGIVDGSAIPMWAVLLLIGSLAGILAPWLPRIVPRVEPHTVSERQSATSRATA